MILHMSFPIRREKSVIFVFLCGPIVFGINTCCNIFLFFLYEMVFALINQLHSVTIGRQDHDAFGIEGEEN